MVRNGHSRERAVQTGLGSVDVRRPRVNDRLDGGVGDQLPHAADVKAPERVDERDGVAWAPFRKDRVIVVPSSCGVDRDER